MCISFGASTHYIGDFKNDRRRLGCSADKLFRRHKGTNLCGLKNSGSSVPCRVQLKTLRCEYDTSWRSGRRATGQAQHVRRSQGKIKGTLLFPLRAYCRPRRSSMTFQSLRPQQRCMSAISHFTQPRNKYMSSSPSISQPVVNTDYADVVRLSALLWGWTDFRRLPVDFVLLNMLHTNRPVTL